MRFRISAAVLLLAALPGCTRIASTSGDERKNAFTIPHVLRYADAQDIATLNPHLLQQATLARMASLTMAWLLKFGPDNRPVPELATEVPTQRNGGISPDGKTIVWHLRRDAKWSDGVAFDGDDVVFSTRVVQNPKNNEISRDGWDLIEKIDQPDKFTVVYHLKKPYANYASTFFGSAGANPNLLPKHLLAKYATINDIPYNGLPVGIGPFKYKEWKRGDHVEMVADPLYFRGRPKLERIVFKIVPDRNTLMTQLKTGELDMWAPPGAAAYYERVRQLRGFTTIKQPGTYFAHAEFNLAHPVLAERAVRQALRYATDRKTLMEKVNHGVGILQEVTLSPVSPARDPGIPLVPFDLGKARALLDGAGWTIGPRGVRVKGNRKLELEFAVPTGTPDTDTRVELIRGWWKQIGVTLDVRHYPASLLFGPYSSGGILYRGKFDVAAFSWGGNAIGDLSNLYGCGRYPPNGQNEVHYCNREVDAAMQKFKLLYDEKARQPLANLIQERMTEDVPVIVLYGTEDTTTYNSDLKNYRPNAITPFDDFLKVDI